MDKEKREREKKIATRVGRRTPQIHSERVDETSSEKQAEDRKWAHEHQGPAQHTKGSTGETQPLRTTSKTEMDEAIEEKEGRMAARTPEEMSLHDELSRQPKKKRRPRKEHQGAKNLD